MDDPSSGLLPPELIDHILTYLRDDKDALQACSLLRRSWRDASQRYLFRNIHLIIEWDRTFTALCEFLASAPHFVPWIETLRLTLPYVIKDAPRSYHSPIYLTALASFLDTLPYLQVVHLDGIFREMGDVEYAAPDNQPATKRGLKRLVIDNIDGNADAMLLCVLLFTEIEELHLPKIRRRHYCRERSRFDWWAGCCDLFSTIPPSLRVRDIVLHHPTALAALMDLTSRGCQLRNLRSLSLTFWRSDWKGFNVGKLVNVLRNAPCLSVLRFKLLMIPNPRRFPLYQVLALI